MNYLKLQTPEDHRDMFESFLAAAAISPAEFKAYLSAPKPYCCMMHEDKQSSGQYIYDGIYLTDTAFIWLDCLTQVNPLDEESLVRYLEKNNLRLPDINELTRFAAWADSMMFPIKAAEEAGEIPNTPHVIAKPVAPENYWTSQSLEKAQVGERRYFVALREEVEISAVMKFMEELYRKNFSSHFQY